MLNLLVKMRLLILRKMLSLFLLILGKFVKTDDKLVFLILPFLKMVKMVIFLQMKKCIIYRS